MFRRPTVHYGKSLEPVTPYQRAAQVWDERIGSARVQAKNWRLAFFGTLALSGGLAAGLVWQGVRGTIVPWVVQVDRLGEAQAVAPADATYQPTDPQIAFHLARFIEEVRRIPADAVVLRHDWLEAYRFVTDRGAQALNDCDLALLCLPDDAAREAVALVRRPGVRVIDASSAHRVAPGWVYGFAELTAGHHEAIAQADFAHGHRRRQVHHGAAL